MYKYGRSWVYWVTRFRGNPSWLGVVPPTHFWEGPSRLLSRATPIAVFLPFEPAAQCMLQLMVVITTVKNSAGKDRSAYAVVYCSGIQGIQAKN